MDVTKLKLQYVNRILELSTIGDAVKLQALKTMMEANADDQDLVEELAMLKAPFDNQLLEEVQTLGEHAREEARTPAQPEDLPTAQISPSEIVAEPKQSLAEKIRQANESKDSGDLIEEIRLTTETMKFSFLRMKDHMANDDVIFDKAKQAQIKNEDGTKTANSSSSAFVAATRVGLIEMVGQICLAILLGLAAIYFV